MIASAAITHLVVACLVAKSMAFYTETYPSHKFPSRLLKKRTRRASLLSDTADDSGGPSSPGDLASARRKFLARATALASGAATSGAVIPTSVSGAASSASLSSSVIAAPSLAVAVPSSLELPPIGLGAWAWGDSLFWGYNPKNDADLKEVFDYAVSKDLAFFDTAELYGLGRSETLLGNFRREGGAAGNRVRVATKFAALPFRTKPEDVVKACRASANRLNPGVKAGGEGFRPIDLYQIHFPNAWANEEYWDGLAQCYELGLVKSVGVSNYGADALRAVHAKLAERGIPLATNQIQLSLLYRYPLENGLLDACKELDVKVLSYSPLALGFLTGKYDKDVRPSGPRAKIAKTLFDGDAGDSFTGLLDAMKTVSGNHGNAPLSQVALNWTRSKGTVPIPGARSIKQAKQNIGALDWNLTKDEVRALDVASSKVPAYVSADKSPFPKEDINTKLKMFDS